MSNVALYRKYRPKTFDEISGQSAIVQTLRNQIITGKIGHAYLFCGLKGSGKTSIARIFATAVNCSNTVNGSPCYGCESCTSDLSELNMIEIDAASNNGVDNIRQLIDEIEYKPSGGAKYKTYIIDEVHMLTSSAFNALLKTLEEPPAHAIFILATTELYKVPVTVRSRCQIYTFHLLTLEEIINTLKHVLEKENNNLFSDECLEYIAKKSEGSARDAVSILDQCIAFSNGQEMSVDKIKLLFGDIDTEVIKKIADYVQEGNAQDSINLLHEQYYAGKNLKNVFNDLYHYYLDQFMYDQTIISTQLFDRYARILGETIIQIEKSNNILTMAELTIIKMCKPEMERDISSVLQRVNNLEKKIGSINTEMKHEVTKSFDENDIVYYNNMVTGLFTIS